MAVKVSEKGGLQGLVFTMIALVVMAYLIGSYLPATKTNVSQSFPTKINLNLNQGNQENQGDQGNQGGGADVYAYPVTYSVKLVDPVNGNTPVSGANVKVYDIYREGMTRGDILEKVRDPYTMVYTNATTDSSGKASFPEKLFMGKTYVFTAENDSYYDLVTTHSVETVPSPSAITEVPGPTWSFYKIGQFADIDAIASVDPTNCFNVTAHSGERAVTCAIKNLYIGASRQTIGVLKNPVLVLRSPEGYELEGNEIRNLVIYYSSGRDVIRITGQELRGYIDNGVIPLVTTKTDPLYPGDGFLTAGTQGVYEVSITYDPATIETGGDKLQICVDDLSAYKGTDLITGVGASPQCYTITWTT